MRLLLQSKANVNKFWESETAFHTAIRNRNKDLVALLLEAKANVNLKYGCELVFYLYVRDFGSRRCGEDSCILLAGGDLPVVRLLAVSGCQLNARNEYVVIVLYHSRAVNAITITCEITVIIV